MNSINNEKHVMLHPQLKKTLSSRNHQGRLPPP